MVGVPFEKDDVSKECIARCRFPEYFFLENDNVPETALTARAFCFY
jgi:hypothetical protein